MTFKDVLEGDHSWHLAAGDCLTLMRTEPANSVDLVLGSPPYAEKGERYQGRPTRRKTPDWIDWMLDVTAKAIVRSLNED